MLGTTLVIRHVIEMSELNVYFLINECNTPNGVFANRFHCIAHIHQWPIELFTIPAFTLVFFLLLVFAGLLWLQFIDRNWPISRVSSIIAGAFRSNINQFVKYDYKSTSRISKWLLITTCLIDLYFVLCDRTILCDHTFQYLNHIIVWVTHSRRETIEYSACRFS